MPYLPLPMSSPIIQQFDIFAQLVLSGSISASADTLGISPADVLGAMDALENRIGYALFQMEGEDIRLTPTGQTLVKALSSLSFAEQEQWISAMLEEEGEETPPSLSSSETFAVFEENIALSGHNDGKENALWLTNAAPDFNPDGSARPDGPGRAPQKPVESPPAFRTILPAVRETAPPPSVSDDTDPSTPADPLEKDAPPTFANTSFASSVFANSVFERPRPPARTITLASHPAIFSHFQEALLAFEQASPDIDISLRLENLGEADIRRLFQQKLADIGYFHALGEGDALSSRYAWSERISLFVGDGHPLMKMPATMADDIAAFPYSALAPGNPARLLTEQALADNGLIVGPALFETDNLYEIMQQVQQKPCYFAAFGPMARDFGKMPGISRIAYAQGLPQVQVRQAVRSDLVDDPIILALSEFLFR